MLGEVPYEPRTRFRRERAVAQRFLDHVPESAGRHRYLANATVAVIDQFQNASAYRSQVGGHVIKVGRDNVLE